MGDQSQDVDEFFAANRPPDRLGELRALVARRRDVRALVADLEEDLNRANVEARRIDQELLPNLMDEAGVTSISIARDGNLPAVTAQLGPVHRASIAARWDEEKRQAAFAVLERLGLGDLIRLTVRVDFGRGEADAARRLVAELLRRGARASAVEDVHHMSLSSALRELCEAGREPSAEDVAAIGGFVGRQVTLKEDED
jgi:hypothetical protein